MVIFLVCSTFFWTVRISKGGQPVALASGETFVCSKFWAQSFKQVHLKCWGIEIVASLNIFFNFWFEGLKCSNLMDWMKLHHNLGISFNYIELKTSFFWLRKRLAIHSNFNISKCSDGTMSTVGPRLELFTTEAKTWDWILQKSKSSTSPMLRNKRPELSSR